MLKADSLACERGGRLLFRDLGFALPPGTLLRVAGANGAGKTSLLRILCGLATPAAGRLTWADEDIAGQREAYTRRLVWIGHANGLKDDLSSDENLAFALRVAGITAPPAARAAALARLGLDGRTHLPTRVLSQGQKRRAALARLALSASVPLWILDEPLAALDVDAVGTVTALIDAHLAAGGSVVLTTHQDAAFDAPGMQRVDLGN